MSDHTHDTGAITMFDRTKKKAAAAQAQDSTPRQSHSVPAPPVTARNTAMIGPSIVIKGEVSGEEDLLIQGRVEGKIDLNGNQVSIGESGEVYADIQAKVIQIDGKVTGDITGSEKVTISKSGNVHGNIVAPRVTLEDGAMFKGSIDMDPTESSVGKAPVTAHQPGHSSAPQLKASGLDLKSV
jgi:cytoskeletal protein CcmA (bactofilin family)